MREKIKERVCRRGKTAVWICRAPEGFNDKDDNGQGWRSIVIPISPTAADLRSVFRKAGAHVWMETDDVLAAGRGYVMVHAASDGEKRINLPTPCNIREIFGASPSRVDVMVLTDRMKMGETRVWKIVEIEQKPCGGPGSEL